MLDACFEDTSEPLQYSVNYVFICPRTPGKYDGRVTRLPLHCFERMYENAARYPDAEFNLWLDFRQLKPIDHFFLASHRYFFRDRAINICDLRTIPEYDGSPGFDIDSNIALYARADCARILVLNYLSKSTDDTQKTMLYSDLDCEDIKIGDAKVEDLLEAYGMIYGRSGRQMLCNGFIAIRGERGRDFLTNFLLPSAVMAFQKNRVNHFGAFAEAVTKFRNRYFPGVTRSTWGVVELPLMRTKMEYNEDIYGGICSPLTTRAPGDRDLV